MRIGTLFGASIVFLAIGCTTTNQSRLRDESAAKLVGDYRTRQEKRIQEATQEYQKTFETQMKVLDSLGHAEFDQILDGDALTLSDQLILEWPELTLPSEMQKALTAS